MIKQMYFGGNTRTKSLENSVLYGGLFAILVVQFTAWLAQLHSLECVDYHMAQYSVGH